MEERINRNNRQRKEGSLMALIGYYGGKAGKCFQQAVRILSPEKEKEVFCEPFSGSGALTLNRERGEWKTEVLNDADIGMATLLQVLADREKGKQLIKRFGEFQVSQANRIWFRSLKIESRYFYRKGYDKMDMAFVTYLLLAFSFNCARQNFRAISQEEYKRKLEKNVKGAYERLAGVIVSQGPASEVIEHYKKNPHALLVCDPPYLSHLRAPGARNVYQREMALSEHIQLLQTLSAPSVKAGVLLFGYWSGQGRYDLYDSILLPQGWSRIFIGEVAKAAAKADRNGKKPRGQEYIWTNRKLTNKQIEQFGKENIHCF